MGVRDHTRVCSSTDEIPAFQLVGTMSLSVPLTLHVPSNDARRGDEIDFRALGHGSRYTVLSDNSHGPENLAEHVAH